MQYVRSISGSVSKTWNSINPATLSGAIDVIVVEQEDGTLACSPFHVRFGKFSLLRPYEKKVEFKVNDVKQDFAMKLGEGGEAFFVFETSDNIPESMQTSPLVSPATSPPLAAEKSSLSSLTEPDFLALDTGGNDRHNPGSPTRPSTAILSTSDTRRIPRTSNSLSASPEFPNERISTGKRIDGTSLRPHSAGTLPYFSRPVNDEENGSGRHASSLSLSSSPNKRSSENLIERLHNLPSLPSKKAIDRARALSERLSASNIPSQVTGSGDLMLDMTGYKSTDEDTSHAEIIARKIISEELEGNCDIGALLGADEHGNLWIYNSEQAKESEYHTPDGAEHRSNPTSRGNAGLEMGYHSEEESEMTTPNAHKSSFFQNNPETPPQTPPETTGDLNRNYAKTLRLTSDQLKALGLKNGPNPMSFTVNRATCQAYMYLWRYDVPIVISDIDGTITKSDALGHVLNMIGRDWTHAGVAKLYTEIVCNGYNIMYLTSRSVGQADTTRAYLNGVFQESYHLPKGPTIMSPDRTIAALRRELYIRKPEVFKMACLRDIKNLFGPNCTPYYAGFGNRFTDALSYRSVSIPSNRIFTINSNAEVSLDLLSLNKLRYSYVNMREVVDHYFPPVNMLVEAGGEGYTDFTYWREPILEIEDFSDSECEDNIHDDEDEEALDEMGESYISRDYLDDTKEDDNHANSEISVSIEDDKTNHISGNSISTKQTKILKVDTISKEGKGWKEDLDAQAITGMTSLSIEKENIAVKE
ncbi:Nuclear elongation and deformation protein 1 [Podosphaera aphanis]|nr:Nuclear elongation and deformation protein 1 [Podosphaera aphanis]